MLKKGFTLAEVLITLTIIGVIAAITMPALMVNVNDAVLENQAKKFYSQTFDALGLYKQNHEIDTLVSGLNMTELANQIMNTSIANADNDLAVEYQNLNRDISATVRRNTFFNVDDDHPLYKLRDGSVFTIRQGDNNTWIIAADVNGRRNPNIIGADAWALVIDTDGNVRIAGNGISANDCLNGDTNGSCMALFVNNNFKLKNYRDNVIANGGNSGSGSGNVRPFRPNIEPINTKIIPETTKQKQVKLEKRAFPGS